MTSFKSYLFVFLISLTIQQVSAEIGLIDNCDVLKNSEIGCHNLGNLIVGPKGLKKLFNEKINNPKFKNELKKSIAKSVKKIPRQVWYSTPDSCNSVTAGEFSKAFTLKKPLPIKGDCILAPEFDEDGKIRSDTSAVPIELAAENFEMDVDEVDFEITEPVCYKGQCSSQIKLKKVAMVSDFTIRKKDGELLSGPSYRLKLDSGKNKKSVPASVNAYIIVKEGGKLDYAIDHSGFKSLKISPDAMKLEPVIRYEGKIYESEDLSLPESNKDSGDVKKRKQILSELQSQMAIGIQCQYARAILQEKNPSEVYEQQYLEYKRKKERKTKLNKNEEEELERNKLVVRTLAAKNTNTNCNEIPQEVFSKTTNYDTSFDIAEARVRGYKDLQTQWLFEGIVGNVINNGPLKDPEFISELIIPEVQEKVLTVAQKEMRSAIRELATTVNPLLERSFEVAVLDLNLQTRKGVANKEIEELTKNLGLIEGNIKRGRGHAEISEASKIKKRLLELKEELKKIDEEFKKQDGFDLDTNYILDSIDGMNRVRIINRMDLCKSGVKIPGMVDGITDSAELSEHDFAFEMPTSILQKYIDQMYKRSPYLCVDDTKKSCEDGRKIHLPGPPTLTCKEHEGCSVNFGTLKTRAMFSDQTLDLNIKANVANCKGNSSNSVCLSFDSADIKNKTTLLWLYDAFPGKTIQQKTNDALSAVGEIDLGGFLPKEVHSSFIYAKPIIKSGAISLPLDLRPLSDSQRMIMK